MTKPPQMATARKKRKSPNLLLVPEKRLSKLHLERIRRSAKQNYGTLTNVIQIAVGTKFIDRSPTDYHTAVQFFVRKKVPRSKLKYQLPTFLYGRHPNGTVDRSVRVPTDVIAIGRVLPACSAGAVVRVTGQQGVLTLLFQNKAEPGSVLYALTCSHVVNGIFTSPPVTRNLTADCVPTLPLFASIIKNAKATNSRLPYDIALARVDNGALPQPNLTMNSGGTVVNFFPSSQITQSLQLWCEFPVSHVLSGSVASSRTSLDVEFPGQTITFQNLFAFHSRARQGDSGGLLHRDGSAVGIFVAVSEAAPEIGFFQPLQEAFEYVKKLDLYG